MTAGVVVVGGGFGALETSLALRKLRPDVSVTVVSSETHVTYRPWLIKVPAGGTQPPVIPFADLLASAGVKTISDRAAALDLDARHVLLQSGAPVPYAQLVVATGAVADCDRVPGARAHALFPCDLEDAVKFAARVSSGARNVAVVFGWERPGPGLEYAAWIAAHRPGVRVNAIDADGTLARRFGERATAHMSRLFERRGGRLISEGSVVRIDESGVVLAARTVDADVVALATPLRGCTEWLPGDLLDGHGMLMVDNAMAAAPGVMGIGDVAAAPAGYRLPPTLLSIRQTARKIAANVIRALDGAPLQPVLRPDQPDLVGPDLAGEAMLVRDRRLVMSGRIALMIRSFMDRSYLRSRRALRSEHQLSGTSRAVS
jgi:3-phenylpropionate/trans-cinnamate dioxygenase ferredoxin reductase subunit